MAQLTTDQAWQAQRAARKRKDDWHSLHSDAFDLIFPDRSDYHQQERGQSTNRRLWDGTATAAIERGANRMMEMTPVASDFIVLNPGPFLEAQMPKSEFDMLKRELAKAASICNAMVQVGGFYTATHEMWLDWMIGCGGMICNPTPETDPGPVAVFEAVPLSQFMVEEGPGGVVHRRYRWWSKRVRDIRLAWPDAKLPEELEELAENKPETETELFEIEYYDADGGEKRWRYELFWHKRKAGTSRLVSRQTRTSMWMTPRHSKRAGEEMGRGPAITALPDIRTANKVVELTFRAIALNLLGIYMAAENGVNPKTIRLVPGAIIPVRSTGGPAGASLVRMDGGNFRPDFTGVILDDVRANIKKALMGSELPPDAGPVRSATEIAARLREIAIDMPAAYGRVMDEFIVPLVQRLLDILHQRGVLGRAIKVDQFYIQVSVSSPLAREQRIGDLERLVQWLQLLQEIGGREMVMLGALMEDVPQKLADILGIDPDVVRPADGPQGRTAIQEKMAQVVAMQAAGQPQGGPVPTAGGGPLPVAEGGPIAA